MKMTSWSLPSSKKSIAVDAIGELELLVVAFLVAILATMTLEDASLLQKWSNTLRSC
jgi:hypothetical protein